MGQININKRRWERLDQDEWLFKCESIEDLPTTGVPVYSEAILYPSGDRYYFSTAGEWCPVGEEEQAQEAEES